ncbi:MAG: DNA polymerase III subunit beta [Oscillospiraceae bacterium]|jgi:DNA polymerase-3 subunit beta|nr:DNA polymerase III subunit beta [Oscillospiraceae bacterium]
MKIICSQQKLEKSVLTVQRAVSAKSTIPTLEGILIKAYNNKILLCGYNLEIGITTTLTENIIDEGEAILNAKIFADIIRKLPDDEVTITSDENLITTIKSKQSKFQITGMNPADYPELPKVKKAKNLSLQSSSLKSMIKQTIFAVADTDTNPIYTGTLFEIENNEIRLVSVDGYRLALRTEPLKEAEPAKFVVPGRALSEVLKLLPENEENINITIGQGHIIFELSDYVLISRLLEGNFLNYKANIPEDHNTEAIVNVGKFIDSTERVSLLITDRVKSPVRFIFEKDTTKISCITSLGTANDEISTKATGEILEIGFNNRFLLDALKNTDCDEVKIQMNGQLNPMKITPKEGNSFLFLVLPVRLKADEDN